MIKKLQKRFLLITMTSVILVVAVLISVINIMNYSQVRNDNNQQMNMITDERNLRNLKERTPIEIENAVDMPEHPGLPAEAAFSARFFSVVFDTNGEVIRVDVENIAAVDEDGAIELAEEVLEQDQINGYLDYYMYQVDDGVMGSDVRVVFLDCEVALTNASQFLITSIMVSAAGVLLVFLVVIYFSKKAVAPIAESYNKQKRFITDASHELKTPLTVIGANTEIIEMEAGESEWTKSTRNQIDRLAKLTENLVTLSRMDEESYEEIKEEINLSDLILSEFEEFTSAGKMANKEFELHVEKDIYYKGNVDKLKKLCTILGENALKYASKNSVIKVKLRKNGKNIEFSTKNQVEQIEKGNRNDLFERFVRADASRNSKTGGHGIGLSIAKAIVHTHKGKISAKSEDGKSLEIKIVL